MAFATRHAVLLLRCFALAALYGSVMLAVDYYAPGDTFCGPDGGCATVRFSAVGRAIGDLLPALGVVAFSVLFAGTLVSERRTLRITAVLAVVGGLVGVGFLAVQGFVIGEFCSLCARVDTAAALAAGAGVLILRSGSGEPEGSRSVASPWWAAYVLAFAPIVWALTFPDPVIPPQIRELWDASADANVVEMSDFECPYCRAMHPLLEQVVEESGQDVHVARITVPLPMHRNARHMSAAYLCAVDAERGEEMADVLFALEDPTHERTLEAAVELGLDEAPFAECMDSEATDERVEADVERARAAGLLGLPQVYVGHRVLVGFAEQRGAEPYRVALAAALAGEGRRVRLWPSIGLGLLALLAGLGGFYLRRGRER